MCGYPEKGWVGVGGQSLNFPGTTMIQIMKEIFFFKYSTNISFLLDTLNIIYFNL